MFHSNLSGLDLKPGLNARLTVAFLLTALFTILISTFSVAQDLVNEKFDDSNALNSWQLFAPKNQANIKIRDGSLFGMRSNHNGLTALSRSFDEPQSRVSIEFSLAFGETRGRAFHVWSQKPNGKDASQLNLCIQNGTLQHYDGRTRAWTIASKMVQASVSPDKPVWHRIKVVIDQNQSGVLLFVSKPGSTELPAMATAHCASYRSQMSIGGLSFVSGTRIATDGWYLVDNLVVRSGDSIVSPGNAPDLPKPFKLWTGHNFPKEPHEIPFVNEVLHRKIHVPNKDQPKFLHGAAIVSHKEVFYANWANSPENENGPHETLQGKRSYDFGKTWSKLEVIGKGFEGEGRHSHGILFEHNEELWTICSRFGVGKNGRKFKGLQGEAFVLNPTSNRWESRGVVMENCWPYDQPMKMKNGNFITGGQDKDGYPVVAISDGNNILRWRSILIPFPQRLQPSFAETTVCVSENNVLAVIRGGSGVAWVATSPNNGESWTKARPSNFRMPRAKAYLGKLSSGQLYLISNFNSRDTLCISIGDPDEMTLNKIYRIRDGKSFAPRSPGRAKARQWSYPYGFEYHGNLYVVYSIGKEECGLSIIPLSALID